LKQGKWIRSVNDYKEEGEYVDDERNGEWISTNNQGVVVFKGSYELGIPVGKHIYYYSDGKVKMKGEYQAGEKEGDWNYYDETGLLENTINYKEGKLNKVDGIKYKE
jgi:antitoxin component YwqK of YwqJK toxin-antitoxin module